MPPAMAAVQLPANWCREYFAMFNGNGFKELTPSVAQKRRRAMLAPPLVMYWRQRFGQRPPGCALRFPQPAAWLDRNVFVPEHGRGRLKLGRPKQIK